MNEYYLGYDIYLHEKGQFWPSLEMGRLGQTKALFLEPHTEQECSFLVTEKTSLDKPYAPCSSDPSYSFTSCMFSFLARSVGCHLNWFHSHMENSVRKCRKKEDILAYDAKLNWVAAASWTELSNVSGCHASCTVRQFDFTECKKERVCC